MGKIVECEVGSWEHFEFKLQELEAERIVLKRALGISGFLFRGQSDSNWKLESTLDRYVNVGMSLSEYYRCIYAAKLQVETFTGQTWNVPSLQNYTAWLKKLDINELNKPQAYEYMAYLRHHGFPSPLIDWTSSPYLAAFFAFDGVVATEGTDHVAIYVYLEYAGSGKTILSDCPWINTLGSYVKTHQRHFLQQSNYTVCMLIKEDNYKEQEAFYARHEDAINDGEEEQDKIWKLIVSKKQRLIFLKKLDSMNINAYSLFGSEESLMRTVALREFKL